MTAHVSEQYYRDMMDNTANFNARLCAERRMRLPFLDSQTGVAQNHCNLWMPYRYREKGKSHGQLYSYPAKRWKKKCHLAFTDFLLPQFPPDVKPTITNDSEGQPISSTAESLAGTTAAEDSNDATGTLPEDQSVAATGAGVPGNDYRSDVDYYGEWDEMAGEFDGAEAEKVQSDCSDYEETYVKKRGKKKDTKKKSGGRASEGGAASSRSSSRRKDKEKDKDKDKEAVVSTIEVTPVAPTPEKERMVKRSSSGSKEGSSKPNSRYCDFCLGDESENKKTGEKEEMVSCADCGRSGHPTCLQFTANMIISVKKYPWQCIECKSCGLCGTSDNDDQLLFCDDCDRGYHMYCLKPPLTEPPEGSWSCHLCIAEFYGGCRPSTSCTSSSS